MLGEEQKKILEDTEPGVLGETVFKSIVNAEDGYYEIGRYLKDAIRHCTTDEQFEAANNIFLALTGYNIGTVMDQLKTA